MSGRFYVGLAYLALAGTVASTLFAVAMIFGRVAFDPLYQFAAFALPLAIAMAALWPLNEDEQILSGASVGLHPSNRRRALSSCFGPYRPRRFKNWLRLPFGRRLMSMELVMAILCLLGQVIVPAAFLMAFLVALRRAAWLGNPDAIFLEWSWFRLRGPISSSEGQRLAARLAATSA